MPFQIEIPDIALTTTKTSFTHAAKEILANLNALIKEWESMQPILRQLQISVGQPNYPTIQKSFLTDDQEIDLALTRYDRDETWVWKAKFVLGKTGKPMTAKEIVETLISKYEISMDKDRALKSMPASLSVAFKDGKIDRRPIEGGEFEYMI